jgi:hypothetical protein
VAAVSLLFTVLALVLTVGSGLILYALVRGERNQRTTDRETAERMARRETDDERERGAGKQDSDEPIEGNHWG